MQNQKSILYKQKIKKNLQNKINAAGLYKYRKQH